MNWFKRVVVVVTCVMVLCCSVLRPVSASAVEVDRIVVSEETVHKARVLMSNAGISTADAAGLLLAFGPDYAAVGATLTSVAPYAVGVLLLSGVVVFAADTMVDAAVQMIDMTPQLFCDICTLIAQEVEKSGLLEDLESIGDAILSGAEFVLSGQLLDVIVNAFNEVAVDSVPGTTVSPDWFEASYLTWTYQGALYSGAFVFNEQTACTDLPIYVSTYNGQVTLGLNTADLPADVNTVHFTFFKNGTSVVMPGYRLGAKTFGDNEFYLMNFNVNNTYWGLKAPTLDDLRANLDDALLYQLGSFADDLTTAVDFWTGAEVAPGIGVDVLPVAQNPAIPIDTPLTVPGTQVITVPGVGAVSVPLVDVGSLAITLPLADVLGGTLDLTTPDGIRGFIGGIADYVSGLFDWLPVQFSSRIDGFFVTLVGLVSLLVVVKIVDLIWPG